MERLTRPLSILLLLFFVACSPWKDVSLRDPHLENLRWSTEEGDPQSLDIRIRAKIVNPNSTSFKIVKSDLELFLDDKTIGTAKLQDKVRIPGNSEEEHSFQVKARLRDVADGSLKALGSVIGGSAPELRMKGFIQARAYGVLKNKFEVDESKRINIGDLMGQWSGSRSSITR